MGLPYLDTQCGAKVLRREVVHDVLPHLAARDLLFDVDLLAAANERGWRIVEVPTVWIDQEGSHVRAMADSRRMGTSLVRLWLRRRVLAARRPGWRS
jgi:dolichyl-phosphate beta-glucosyltransferase